MNLEITTIFCLCDDFIKELGINQDPQQKMSDSEVIIVGLVATRYFSGNISHSRQFLKDHNYIKSMLSKSRLIRRLHRIPKVFWQVFVGFLSRFNSAQELPDDYIVDSFPLPACHSVRISRRRLFKDKKYIGYNASKEQYFCGLKVHVIISASGQPMEFLISSGSEHDMSAFKKFAFNTLTKHSRILGDKAYNDYAYEEFLKSKGLSLCVARKENSKKPQDLFYTLYGRKIRKYIETVFSQMTGWIKGKIHAVTNKGFEIKICLLLIAFSASFIFRN